MIAYILSHRTVWQWRDKGLIFFFNELSLNIMRKSIKHSRTTFEQSIRIERERESKYSILYAIMNIRFSSENYFIRNIWYTCELSIQYSEILDVFLLCAHSCYNDIDKVWQYIRRIILSFGVWYYTHRTVWPFLFVKKTSVPFYFVVWITYIFCFSFNAIPGHKF